MEEMSEKEFDMSEEPSVTSSDPNERKLARRLRIQRRLEALKKQEACEEEGIIEKTQTERQIETSAEILEKLIAEGDEVVSNVKVANEARGADRREEDTAIRRHLLKKLEDEADESLKKFQIVNEKWSSILASKDPLDIHESIQSQSAECEEILRQKDIIIEELKQELENADEKFTDDRKKQSEDINLLIERIENQVNSIAKAYRKELVLIEEALNSERSSLLESVAKRWDALYQKRHEEELSGVERRKEIMREYEIEMRRVMTEHHERYRFEKIELETECQKLQLEVERMKAVCMMNIEKLNYNYAILKRREDENTIVKSQQKRRINKLQDVINGLKKNYNELEENTRLEIQKLSEQVTKARKNIVELEAKSDHFTRTNDKRFFDIWDMNTRKANELVEKILTADRIIHEQVLGLDWKPPELALLKKEDLPSYSGAINEIQKSRAEIEESMKILERYEKPTDPKDLSLERRLLSHILQQISDHTGFLIEDKLRELLAPRTHHENIIIRLDNVFQALGIKSEDQIDLLLNFFLPYAHCAICASESENFSIVGEIEKGESLSEENVPRNASSEDSKIPEDRRDRDFENATNIRQISESEGYEKSESIENSEEGSVEKFEDIEREIFPERSFDEVGSSSARKVTCEKGHLLEIDSASVTKALREFAEKHRTNEPERIPGLREKLSSRRIKSLSRCLTDEDIKKYWKRYEDIFPAEKEKLWDGLLIGLKKYHEVLKERHALNSETECLKKQNAELRRLLETYAVKPGNGASMPSGSRTSKTS